LAGPWVKSAVPGAILRGSSPGTASRSAATPTSTTVTSAPAWAANALTTAPPARKLATIWAVTSCGHGVTPWACTPWSAAKTATQAGSGSGGGQLPARPASRTDTSSRAPSEPRGLVIRSCRSRAAAIALASGGTIAASTSASGFTGSSSAMGVGVGRGRVMGVVMGKLRRPDAVLEPGHRDPVHAHVAVHPDVPGQRLVVPLVDQRGDLVAVAEHVGDRDVELRMRGGVGGGLFGHPVRQHAGEQEVPGHHDPLCAGQAGPRQASTEQAAPLQALGHVGPGQRDE